MSVSDVALQQSKHWVAKHRALLAVVLGAVVLFLLGLALHELGYMPEPINSWYEWLHEHTPGAPSMPMGKWMWTPFYIRWG